MALIRVIDEDQAEDKLHEAYAEVGAARTRVAIYAVQT